MRYFSSFRFDFRGNGESDGKPGYANMKEDAHDIATVATHFEKKGYEVYGIIGRSRVKNMPLTTCVLTVHGINDNNVPVYNAAMYANAIPNHTLALLPDTDHNFTGHFEDVVKSSTDWTKSKMTWIVRIYFFIIITYLETLENGKQSFGNVLYHIIKEFKPDTRNSMLVHCTSGKDRTGLWCMLLLGICGVDDEVIEYALSSLGYWLSDEEVQHHGDHIKIPVEIMKSTCSAPYEAMKICLTSLKEQYGSIEMYVQTECGLSVDKINKLRQLMVVAIPFAQKQFYRGQVTASSYANIVGGDGPRSLYNPFFALNTYISY
ncbi:protein-tyrosine phosphatase-like protein [Absidia repens]|uniref:Protein-tyrosine phosphatase-like protein n=1 Tax=Absidia repens TaxID=90262 RepID=A0A1X2IGA1_9FUNG|nr:protein-tyrosine phosphatase-like protein [Absidia repens]